MKLSESLKSLATLSGIKEDDANLVKLLAATDKLDIDDTLAATLGSNLLTMDAAKNNPTLKGHFTGQALSTVDSKIEHLISQYGLEEEDINELKAVKSSYDRLEKVTEKIAKLTEKKAGKSTGDNAKAIAKLEGEKAELVKQLNAKQTEYENSLTGFKANFMLENILSGMQYTLPEGLSGTEKTKMVKTILQNKFDELGVVLNLDNDKLIPKTKENTIYYKNNQPIGTEDLIKSILTEKKLIKVAEAPRKPNTPTPVRRPDAPNEVKFVPDSLDSEVERQIQQQLG